MEWVNIFADIRTSLILSVWLPKGLRKTIQKKQEREYIQKTKTYHGRYPTVYRMDGCRYIPWAAKYIGKEIMVLYRNRWQVELLFKRSKQNFSVTIIKAGSTNSAEAVTLLWLIIWTIMEQQAFMVERFLIRKWKNTYSTYEKYKI